MAILTEGVRCISCYKMGDKRWTLTDGGFFDGTYCYSCGRKALLKISTRSKIVRGAKEGETSEYK